MGSTIDDAMAECENLSSKCLVRWFSDQEPVHTVFLSAFYIDTYEVTNAQYAECVAAGACKLPSSTSSRTRISYYRAYLNYPVIFVNWEQANAYCTWRGARLPTEAEWEYAARGGLEEMNYPWGDTFDSSLLNFCDANCLRDFAYMEYDDGYADTSPVGHYAPNGYGLYDMAGNVWEWVYDWYGPYPPDAATDPTGPVSGSYCIARGGSLGDDPFFARVTQRLYTEPGNNSGDLGFRCAFSPETSSPQATLPAASTSAPALDTPVPSSAAPEGMVFVPAGTFQMGGDANKSLAECQKFASDCSLAWYMSEEPIHSVSLSAFYMDMYEVTNAQYAECVASGVCSAPRKNSSGTRDSYYGNADFDGYPVIYVTWEKANTYCTWRGGRLPTEAEWEYAARGGLEGMHYPWGESFDGTQANFCDASCPYDYRNLDFDDAYADTAPVGSYAPNGFGLYDMAGNVWEWVSDYYGMYPPRSVTDPSGPELGEYYVLRGGGWDGVAYYLGVSFRYYAVPNGSAYSVGFRCVIPAEK